MNREDMRVAAAVRRELPQIARAIEATVNSLERGGHLFYVGAGTSGRIAVLDAAECPPTFGVSPQKVRAIVAGGPKALRRAIEGAEDSPRDGARDLRRAAISRRDVVVVLSASGATPYALGALDYARRIGAVTIGLTANSDSPLAKRARIAIAPDTGPEVITGSTRLKAGTAQKLVLNMLSTAAMVRLGRIYDNWMVSMALTNGKLRERGTRILEAAAGVNARAAEHALRQGGHDLPVALVMLKTGAGSAQAKRSLRSTGGNIRRAVGMGKNGRRGSAGKE